MYDSRVPCSFSKTVYDDGDKCPPGYNVCTNTNDVDSDVRDGFCDIDSDCSAYNEHTGSSLCHTGFAQLAFPNDPPLPYHNCANGNDVNCGLVACCDGGTSVRGASLGLGGVVLVACGPPSLPPSLP